MTTELAEIRSGVSELTRATGRIEGSLQSIESGMAAHNLRDEKLFDAIEKRLRKVENRQHWYSGVGAVIGILIGLGGHKMTGG